MASRNLSFQVTLHALQALAQPIGVRVLHMEPDVLIVLLLVLSWDSYLVTAISDE